MKTVTLTGTEIEAPAVVTGVMRIQEKSDAEVRVLLTANRSWGDADCADSVVVTLASPLGTRAVVDGATDRRVEVLPREG